jgi:type IV secretion system protein VirB10
MADDPVKTPRKKTDRKMFVWVAVIGMLMLVVYLFASQGSDLGQSEVDAERARQAKAAQAELYSAKVANPVAATQQQVADAEAEKAKKEAAERAERLKEQNKALSDVILPPGDDDMVLPPPSSPALSDARLSGLEAAAGAVGDKPDADSGDAPVHGSFVVFQAEDKKKSSGPLGPLAVDHAEGGANANASAQDDPSKIEDPQVRQAYQQVAAAQKQRDDLLKLAQAKAQESGTPGAEGNQAWLYQNRNEKVDLATSKVAQRSDARYWLAPGTVIQAVVQNAVDTSLPGVLTARVTQAVYDSRYGRYLVIPAGSVIKGSYNTSVADGQRRVMLGFDTLITPSGGMVDLGSLSGSDGLGRAGMPGKLHTRFWPRMGIATLLAIEAVGMDRLNNKQQIVSPTGATGSQAMSSGGEIISSFANEEIKRRAATGPYITAEPGAVMSLTLTEGVEIPPLANTR